ncbi:hypothetical protein [Kitasatospora sp. NPDC059571]|uniref:hypothetical protein n=1 Tax=Kitasatospora sp. NPDC059571 TaxID=3346871 RepID=UPI0036B8C85D
MSDGFRAHPDRLGEAAKKAHEHADKVEAHSRKLDAATRGRVLGRGPLGRVVEKSVRPVIDSMITDMSKAMAKGHRSLGQGLEITKKNLDDAERAVQKGLREGGSSLPGSGVDLKPGQSVPGRQGLRELYKRRVEQRVDEIDGQGHAVGRHLRVTDQQLKDRLGVPVMQGPQGAQYVAKERKTGYVVSTNKIDPLHGPDAKTRLPEPNRYYDAEKAPNKHICGTHSTAFSDSESFVHAEAHARSRLNPADPGPQTILFSPSEAWGPGGHLGRMRGYFIDPDHPLDPGGAVNYREVDFTGARIRAIYHPDGKGGHKLHTMFPEPQYKHNRPRH